MAEWEQDDLRLHSHHGWRARPGCKIFVADRGAVRFDYPQDWFVVPEEDSVKLCDKEAPGDDSRLPVSYLRLPPADWSGLPLAALLDSRMREDGRAVHTWRPR